MGERYSFGLVISSVFLIPIILSVFPAREQPLNEPCSSHAPKV